MARGSSPGRSAPAGDAGESRADSEPAGDDAVRLLRCDHRHDAEVDATFDRILDAVGAIDILVNGVWGGYDQMVEDGAFTWGRPFWEQPLWRWDAMFAAGVRAHYRASQRAAASMVARRRGLIVNVSHWAAVAGGRLFGESRRRGSDKACSVDPVAVHGAYRPCPARAPS